MDVGSVRGPLPEEEAEKQLPQYVEPVAASRVRLEVRPVASDQITFQRGIKCHLGKAHYAKKVNVDESHDNYLTFTGGASPM